jgi:hypothetical protein
VNFLAAENVRQPIIARLREEGHDVLSVAKTSPGIDDFAVIERARQTSRVLLTHDLGFSARIFGQHLAPPIGVIQLRFSSRMRYAEMARLVAAAVREGHPFRGYLATVDERQVRFRRSPPST